MKKFLLSTMFVLLILFVTSCESRVYEETSEIIEVTSYDDYTFKGRLSLPSGQKDVAKLVIFVNGSGANTYENHRKVEENTEFNYYDLYANEFSERKVAFFSYNTRGVDVGTEPPMYATINEDEYKTYLPSNSVEDVYYMIKTIKENERLRNCKVYLLGWSEGTIIAPLVARKYPNMVDGLLLAGYANQNMRDILIWQNSGGSSMVWYNYHFDADGDGSISKQEYDSDPNNVIESVLQNARFEDLDLTDDGYISEDDIAPLLKDGLDEIFAAIERGDDEWLRNNYGGGYIPLTSGWFLEHFTLSANKEVLPLLDLPIHIFHGTVDLNVDVREVDSIDSQFQSLGKTNLATHIFEGHDHDLNYGDLILKNEISKGIRAIFDTVDGF